MQNYSIFPNRIKIYEGPGQTISMRPFHFHFIEKYRCSNSKQVSSLLAYYTNKLIMLSSRLIICKIPLSNAITTTDVK